VRNKCGLRHGSPETREREKNDLTNGGELPRYGGFGRKIGSNDRAVSSVKPRRTSVVINGAIGTAQRHCVGSGSRRAKNSTAGY